MAVKLVALVEALEKDSLASICNVASKICSCKSGSAEYKLYGQKTENHEKTLLLRRMTHYRTSADSINFFCLVACNFLLMASVS